MTKILIPFYDPNSEILESLPIKVTLFDNRFEFQCKHRVITEDEEKAIKEEIEVDNQLTILKSAIIAYQVFKDIKSTNIWVFKVQAGSDEVAILYEEKSDAKNMYSVFDSWYNANS